LLKKAVIAAAGLGTRLLSFTKEQPKEMLPIYTSDSQGRLSLKPIIQLIFEQVYDFGIRDFCFVVGRGKRAIEDHFTPDYHYQHLLGDKNGHILDLENFYKKLKKSTIFWVNQSPNIGFGHAVLQAEPYITDDEFFVFAGDTLIVSRGSQHLRRLVSCYENEVADAAFLTQRVSDPENYGIVFGVESQQKVHVNRVVEKPLRPESNLAIMPIYIFKKQIFKFLRNVRPDHRNEIQLTDAIQSTVTKGKVIATRIMEDELRLEIGSPETYFNAQVDSFKYSVKTPI
jgi:UTP--glucose-1-phosphate uridylyltransferase